MPSPATLICESSGMYDSFPGDGGGRGFRKGLSYHMAKPLPAFAHIASHTPPQGGN
jgi:hypothetical protein